MESVEVSEDINITDRMESLKVFNLVDEDMMIITNDKIQSI